MGLDVFMRRNNKGRGRMCRWCRRKIEDGEYSMGIIDIYISGGLVSAHFHDDCWDKMVQAAEEVRREDVNE